ncbi:LCP family protein [Streptomyces sp. NPDC050560]|uniref:LCP family protein n=1 Tax=Streptomyces sp. NPDC050560 TaxID=3365630 RepID=UPI0037B0958E
MRQGSVRGEGAGRGVRRPEDSGWDDSLYDDSDDSDDSGDGANGAGPAEGSADTARDGAGDGGDGAATARDRPGGRGRRVLRWSATVLAVLILGTAGAGYLYYQHLNNNIHTDDLNLGDHKAPAPEPNAAGQTPLNILLIGSDARDSKENQKLGGAKDTFGGAPRADVQMLLHLSADRSNMSVISMPRDTLVNIPKCTDPDSGKAYPATTGRAMTNETLGRGGPGCTVATWEQLTGIHVDHFMMVDFAGVVSMADAVGGVPVCVDANIYSKDSAGHGSGLKLTKGTHSVKGEQALAWLRTRYGFEDNTDIGRTKAQHQYMNSLARQLRENATLSSPGKLRGLAETATKALRVDNGLGSVKKLYDLSNELRKVSPKRITMTTMPWQWAPSDPNRVEPKPGDAEQLFRLVREDISLDGKDKQDGDDGKPASKTPAPPADPDGEIPVTVQNGTRTEQYAPASGRAGEVVSLLAAKGLTRASADQSVTLSAERTEVHYAGDGMRGDALRVAGALGIPSSAVHASAEGSSDAGDGVTLVVGSDWRTGDTFPKQKQNGEDGENGENGEKDNTTPDSADVLNGAKKACMHVNPSYTF